MKRFIFILVAVITTITLFISCENNEPKVEKDLLIGTKWERTNFFGDSKYRLEFLESNKIKYTIVYIKNGIEEAFGDPTILEYNISKGIPLIDNEAILIIGNTYSYQGDKIIIYKDFLLWEGVSVVDGKHRTNTFQKI